MNGRGSVVRVCYVLAYRDPDYIRTRSLLSALRTLPDIELVLVINKHRGLGRYLEVLGRLIRSRLTHDCDIFILGFRGHEIAWLLRWIVGRRPLVLDALMSPYLALLEERKAGRLGALFAKLWRPFEACALLRANLVLTDTPLHARCYADCFGVPAERVLALPVGAVWPEAVMTTQSVRASGETLKVLFYGSFLPLHGWEIIVQAAARLRDLPLEFRFIGGTQRQASQLRAACARYGVDKFTHSSWVPFDTLITDEIPAADVCLGGPFGNTPQAQRVVTGKTSQCLAQGRATVVGKIDADYGFRDRQNCLLVQQGSPKSLADALRWAHVHREELPRIGESGRALYAERLSVDSIARDLGPALYRLVGRAAKV